VNRRAIVIGAGMGGLTAALRLARRGIAVRVIEAYGRIGGLAAGLEFDGFPFDGGPYLLLDRPGLEWAFRALGLDLAREVPMQRVEEILQVQSADGGVVCIGSDLNETAARIEENWRGGGQRYRAFVTRVTRIYEKLRPLLTCDRPSLAALLRSGAWRELPFLCRSLGSVLRGAELPPAVADAVSIWTHVAGQTAAAAPSPMACVTAILHGVGAFLPTEGIGAVPLALGRAARMAGVEFIFGTTIAGIRLEQGRARGVTTTAGETLEADAVISNRNGVGTYLELAREAISSAVRSRLQQIPLQSPGVCAYLAVRGGSKPPYLRFRLPGDGELCRLLVCPAAVLGGLERDGWAPARLIAPLAHEAAQRLGPDGQKRYLERVLSEPWWREHVGDVRVLGTRTPTDWAAACHLYNQSMNPVMTSRLMRAGRLAHRSSYVRRLYLAGSSTHPGQWVSFCAISGILAADRAIEDLS
jgi:phytoene desaturase